MHSYDVIGYAYEGAIYCPDCIGDAEHDEECSPIFAEYLDSEIGATCETCHMCLDSNGDWVAADDITNKLYYRWSRCRNCGDQRPWDKSGGDYTSARRDSLAHSLTCRNCLKPDVRF